MKRNLLFAAVILFGLVIRIIWLDRFPPSLYSDEADQGYNAFSILTTGRDEHGIFLPVSFRSFGDWKPPLPTYLMVPFVYLFGLNEISVRLPSVILGAGSIILVYYLVRILLDDRNDKTRLALLSAFLLAISPWHILQSRSAMLVIVSLFFLEAGVLFFLAGLKKPLFFIISSLSFVLTIYAYYGMRIITPLLVILLFWLYRKRINIKSREVILSVILGLLILMPLGISFLKKTDVLLGRARTVSVFYDQGVKLLQWRLITEDGMTFDPSISRLFHNNVNMFGRRIIRNFLSHFEINYIFVTGDKSPPFQIPGMGIIYIIDGIMLLTGVLLLFRNKIQARGLIVSCLLISIIPAAFTFMVPSANRTFNAVVPIVIFTAVGLDYFSKKFRRLPLLNILIILIYASSFGYFMNRYFVVLPRDHADWWNYGWKETVALTARIENNYDNIIFPDNGMPYIYYLFYNTVNPADFQKKAVRSYVADRFGFEHIEAYNKYTFNTDFDWKYLKNNLEPKSLYIIPAAQADDRQYLAVINFPNGKPAYRIYASD